MTKTPRANGSPPREIDPLDLYSVRASLSDEERLVQDSIGKFVDERVLPIIGECFEHERFPRELIPEIAQLGVLGCTIEGYEDRKSTRLNSSHVKISYAVFCLKKKKKYKYLK